nr:hypothetical protein [Allomuricauda sp.]
MANIKSFSQIDTSLDSNVIGAMTEYKQIVIDEESLKKSLFYKHDYNNVLSRMYDIDDINQFDLGNIKGQLFKDAIFTDIMKFSPFIRGSEFIVSDEFVNQLKAFGVSDKEYSLKSIKIERATQNYYLLFVPRVNLEHINFKKSVIYRSKLFGTEPIEYLNLWNYDDFQTVLDKHTFISFEKLALQQNYEDNDIISIPQVTSHMFFSNELIKHMRELGISNLVLKPNKQVDLVVKYRE